jgi:hypothetical protein
MRYYCQTLIKLQFSRHIFEKCFYTDVYENPPSGSRVFPCGRMDRQADMTKPIVTSRNFTIAPVKANESLSAGWKVSNR